MASLSGDERQLGVWIARAKTSMQEATELKNALKSHKEEALALRQKAEAAEEAIQVLLNQEKQREEETSIFADWNGELYHILAIQKQMLKNKTQTQVSFFKIMKNKQKALRVIQALKEIKDSKKRQSKLARIIARRKRFKTLRRVIDSWASCTRRQKQIGRRKENLAKARNGTILCNHMSKWSQVCFFHQKIEDQVLFRFKHFVRRRVLFSWRNGLAKHHCFSRLLWRMFHRWKTLYMRHRLMTESELWFLDRHEFLTGNRVFLAWKCLGQELVKTRVRFEKCRGLIRRSWYRLLLLCFGVWLSAMETARLISAKWMMKCNKIVPAQMYTAFLSWRCRNKHKVLGRITVMTKSTGRRAQCTARHFSCWVDMISIKRKCLDLKREVCEQSARRALQGVLNCWKYLLHLATRRSWVDHKLHLACSDVLRTSFVLWTFGHLQLCLKISRYSLNKLRRKSALSMTLDRWMSSTCCADYLQVCSLAWSRAARALLSFRALLSWKLVLEDRQRKHERRLMDQVMGLKLMMLSCWKLFAATCKTERAVVDNFQSLLMRKEAALILQCWRGCVLKQGSNCLSSPDYQNE
mmetsp:Transcript_49162/g.154339  ORF Transcript_49162/g.154339 Transcript_49162/m.154339 type:complete len:581 (-) Transcript_49162:4-1746(-)